MVENNAPRGAQWAGLPMKQLTLLALTFQNSALILIMHYSRIMPLVDSNRYFTSTAVFINEVLKLGISVTMALYEMSNTMPPSTPATTLFGNVSRNIFTGDSWKLGIPAVLYTFQNTLQYVAVSNLDAATFQVTYQLKILTTALFSVVLLGRTLSGRKWGSLVLLMIGVGVVQLPTKAEVTTFTTFKESQAKFHIPRTVGDLRDVGRAIAVEVAERATLLGAGILQRSATYEGIEEDRRLQNPTLNAQLGLFAVVIACMLSGLAGVYFEKVLKDGQKTTTMWTRNVQLSFYSLFPSFFIGVLFKDGEEISKLGFFAGYNWVVWTAITFQAAGGVIVALVVNYADNIAKNFATSISILLSFIASVWFFDLTITLNFVLGTAIVLFATYMYSSEDMSRASQKLSIAPYEKTTIEGDPNFFEQERSLLSPSRSEDEELLAQPYVDRRVQAERGTARLSLAPTTTRSAASTTRPNLSQYSRPVVSKHSSSPPRIMPSSPSLDVGKRRDRDRRALQSQFSQCSAITGSGTQPSGSLVRKTTQSQALLKNQLPIVHGVRLVPRSILPDRFRTVFPFPLFNAVQSKSIDKVYHSDDNFVLSSPTGSGKTAILELAICRAIGQYPGGQFKIVYQAPFKALCSERYNDWQRKFGPLDLPCAELTGDTEANELKNVQNATIIITTPEKWDSLTRKWKDHERLMRMVKLFLIDEVHILKDERGPTLEAIVSRMKSMGTDMRFVALSATVPNLEDVAMWLGRNSREQNEPAPMERFGEELRPVMLEKHVCGYNSSSNDFALDKTLTSKLSEVIPKYSHRKPIMVFCMTQKSAVSTAKTLANWWSERPRNNRFWDAPNHPIPLADGELRAFAASGVAFHHGSVDSGDRHLVEKAYLAGDISVICCTSTLAAGINLPCHMVIIKNTVAWSGTGPREYSDLEIMQMLGRAGRPQFDNTAVGVIMTSSSKVAHYENLVSGQEPVESQLHLNLIEHLNAEVTLGTTSDLQSAKRWLGGTFLSVRMLKNPTHYEIDNITDAGSLDERLSKICSRNMASLKDHELVCGSQNFRPTEYGNAMARYYVRFDTMLLFLGLPRQAKVSEILSALAQAAEYRDIRFRIPEKSVYKEVNGSNLIKFSIKVDLALPAHKTSLLMQMALGGVDFPRDEKAIKCSVQFGLDQGIVFKHINRLVRCVIDCQLFREDALAARNALMLERSFSARAWDDSPLQLTQLEHIGPVAGRKLMGANICSIEDLENTEPHRLETILKRYPPFGRQVLDSLKSFPKLRVGMQMTGHSVSKSGEGVKVHVKAEIGFMNEKPPLIFRKRPVFICVLAETSDGRVAHFARTSSKKLNTGLDLFFSATLTAVNQHIICYVMCESIAGTLRRASLTHQLSPYLFPKAIQVVEPSSPEECKPMSNISRRRADVYSRHRSLGEASEDYGDDDLDDEDFAYLAPKDLNFEHIDDFKKPKGKITHQNQANDESQALLPERDHISEPERMENGNYFCNHVCKNKLSCKHLCCREGLEKPPKKSAKKRATNHEPSETQRYSKTAKKQIKLDLSATKLKSEWPRFKEPCIEIDLTQTMPGHTYTKHSSYESQSLHRSHSTVQRGSGKQTSNVPDTIPSKPRASDATSKNLRLSFLPAPLHNDVSSDYGDVLSDINTTSTPPHCKSKFSLHDDEEDDIESLEEAMIGVTDSQDLKYDRGTYDDESFDCTQFNVYEDVQMINQASQKVGAMRSVKYNESLPVEEKADYISEYEPAQVTPTKSVSLFVGDTSRVGPAQKAPVARTTGTASTFFSSRAAEAEDLISTAVGVEVEHNAGGDVVIPPGYEGIDPCLIAEFGDIVDFT
ncbi:hypothetical protein EJ05DRAFT_533103 [Pseudovirgaria hyperparasitica]|uniref:DNA 3'-5' helicase n=1 Tax=Pseudovirgaria hyperparasitica TaxID=470096 RepID=A0A6A6VYE3_9PEZI|nr:uncharacterized protein EJ05DRAFT_533103 [Pseudovirgaria hyperparasitica]KAF2754879.1 hypothetical protein EJ05DRAFT_533103 [Pseudovirgaria hyperparasitica]